MRVSCTLMTLGGFAVAALTSCAPASLPPEGAFLVYLSTDAPVPDSYESAPWLFDRVRIELYAPGASEPCEGCTREVPLERTSIADARLSFGVMPPPGMVGNRLRLRMFHSLRRVSLEPSPDGTVELWLELPPAAEEGLVELTAFLPTDAVGGSIGSAAEPSTPQWGAPTGSVVGSWSGAERLDCADPPQIGEVCVPGGAFWMGNPLAETADVKGVSQQRIVVVAPFYLDVDEVSVAMLRASGIAAPSDPLTWSGEYSGDDGQDLCAFTSNPSMFEEHPINCLSWHKAREYCMSRPLGGDLPSEAQYEYAAGGLHGFLYVWGVDEPGCGDAVYGRGFGTQGPPLASPCREPNGDGRPLPVSRADYGRDSLVLPTGLIHDLAGNVTEWTLDVFEPEGGTCWGSGVLYDPRCESGENAPDDAPRSIRGGAWMMLPEFLRAASRALADSPGARTATTGFRCARPATPK